jgi:hypothetical protein
MCIAGFLAPEDLVCFSLCNRQIYRFFPSQRSRVRVQYKSHYSTEEDKNIRLSILSRLDRDWPSYFTCYYCHHLHKYDGSECFGLCGPLFPQSCKLFCLEYVLYTRMNGKFQLGLRSFGEVFLDYRCEFISLQLAMRRRLHPTDLLVPNAIQTSKLISVSSILILF